MKGDDQVKKGFFAALGAACVLLASCSGPLPGEAVANAADLASEQGSAKVFMKISNSLPAGDFEIAGEGELDFAGQKGHMTMDPSTSSASAPAAALGPIEMVFTSGAIYMRTDSFEELFPDGKEWMKIDLKALGEEQGIDLQQLQQLGQGDPSQQLDYLRGAGEVEEVGSEEIRGVDTTHYKAVVDMDKVAEQHPEAADSIRRAQELTGVETVPTEVWIDSDGLPRRMSMSMDLNAATGVAAGSPSKTLIIMEFFDYGADVVVEIPPDHLTLDPSQLQG